MHWAFSEEQRMYESALGDWLNQMASTVQVRAWMEQGGTGDFWRAFVRDGWAGVGLSESAGGQGGGVIELALTSERLGYAAAPGATWLTTTIASPALDAEGVRAALGGGGVALLVDADLPPDAAPGLVLSDGRRLTGCVPRVLGAADVGSFVAVVQTPQGRALHLIDGGAPGVEIVDQVLLDRTRTVGMVSLSDVDTRELSSEAENALARASALAAVLTAADALGALERMLEMVVVYAGQRHQFGVPIGSFQAVKHAAAELEVSVEAGRSALYYAAASVEADDAAGAVQAAAVKAELGAHAAAGADTALTLHGAIGYTWEHDLQLFYKRTKLDSALFGAAPIWLDRIAEHLLPR